MCRPVLLVVLWLLIGTRSRLLVVGLLSIEEALLPSLCLFGTILVTLCLMVWDLRVSRADPMFSVLNFLVDAVHIYLYLWFICDKYTYVYQKYNLYMELRIEVVLRCFWLA